MTIHSAGIVLYRGAAQSPPKAESEAQGTLEVLLVHPGGPFFAKKDTGSWSIPKGEYEPTEEQALAAALREFAEETGGTVGGEDALELGWVEQRKGKIVHAFAVEGDFDPLVLVSNTFEMEWPPHSGRRESFPEVDRGEWFSLTAARDKMVPGQAVFLDRLSAALAAAGSV